MSFKYDPENSRIIHVNDEGPITGTTRTEPQWEEMLVICDNCGHAIHVMKGDIRKPERKRGEWIPKFNGKFTGGAYWFSCSKCNRIVPEVRNGGWNFCPNCGADMRKEDNHE